MSGFLTNEALYQKSPQQVTSLLYEACYDNLEEAIELIKKKEFTDANSRLQKASDIVHRLGVGLNYEAGILADQLEQLYNYIADRLIQANLHKDVEIIKEILTILNQIMSAWNEAMKTKQDQQSQLVKQKTNRYEQAAIYDN